MNRDAGEDPFQGAQAGMHCEITSRTMPVQGDAMRLGTRLKPGSARGGGVEIELQGSTDGMSWARLASLTAASRAWATGNWAVSGYAFVRLRTRLMGGGGPVGFDTRVAFHPE